MSSQTEQGKSLKQFTELMKRDWNDRARENAKWFVNTAKLDQTDEEFDASGAREMEILVLPELSLMTEGRDPRGLSLLEIGCGVGRMTKHLASVFGEVHSTDVSGEMIRQARMRLRNFPNVRFYETNGIDLAELPDGRFDVVFSAYVFQHAPSKDVIVSNLRDAWRVVKEGGILKFHTNAVEAADYEAMEKDTWAGATFTESEIRDLARELGAQLISIYGRATGYCWAMFRKKLSRSGAAEKMAPRIEFYARADNPRVRTIPTGGDDAWLALIASGMDREYVDANCLQVEIDSRPLLPRYVGRVRPHFEAAVAHHTDVPADRLTYIEVGVPPGAFQDKAMVRVKLDGREASPLLEIQMEEAGPAPPIIVTIRNGEDHGTDSHARGPKSLMKLSVVGLDETADCENVRLKINDRIVTPVFVGFVTGVAGYQVDAQLPLDTEPGTSSICLRFGDLESAAVKFEIKP